MKFDAVLFDVDGVIISNKSVLRCLRDTIKEFGLKPKFFKELDDLFIGFRIEEALPRAYPELKNRTKEFYSLYDKLYLKNYRKYSKPLPYVKRTLDHLKKNKVKVGIVTSKGRTRAKQILDGFNLYYNALVSIDDVKHEKPDPEPLLKACKLLNVDPKKCVYFGDHVFDMMAAKGAGCYGVGVLTGHSGRKELKNSGAKLIIKDLSEFRKIVE